MTQAGLTELRTRGRDLIGRAQFGGQRIVLQHRGKPVAALISMENLQLLEELEDEYWIRRADEAEAEPGRNILWEQIKVEPNL